MFLSISGTHNGTNADGGPHVDNQRCPVSRLLCHIIPRVQSFKERNWKKVCLIPALHLFSVFIREFTRVHHFSLRFENEIRRICVFCELRRIPLGLLLMLGISSVVTIGFSNNALKYINYPTQVRYLSLFVEYKWLLNGLRSQSDEFGRFVFFFL